MYLDARVIAQKSYVLTEIFFVLCTHEVFGPSKMSEAFNLTNAEVDKRKLLEEIECLKLTATQAIEFNGLFLSEENVSSDHALFAQKSFDVGDYCRHGDGKAV